MHVLAHDGDGAFVHGAADGVKERLAHVADTAAQDDQARVEQVDEVDNTDADEEAGALDDGDGESVALLKRSGHNFGVDGVDGAAGQNRA